MQSIPHPPTCYFCGSEDTMAPFKRSDSVLVLSWLLPLRWRYCRECTRHFLSFRRPAVRPVGEYMQVDEGRRNPGERAA